MAPSTDGTAPWKAVPVCGQPVSLMITFLPAATATVRWYMLCM